MTDGLTSTPDCICNKPPCDGVCWYGKQRQYREALEAVRRRTAEVFGTASRPRFTPPSPGAYAAGWRKWGGPK